MNGFLSGENVPAWLWPPVFGLLDVHGLNPLKPRDQWTLDEWRLWAEFLEERGKSYATEIVRLTDESKRLRLAYALLKLKRKRGRPTKRSQIPSIGLLSITAEKKKIGRPKRSVQLTELFEQCETEFQEQKASGGTNKRMTFIRHVIDPKGTKPRFTVDRKAKRVAKGMADVSQKLTDK